MCEKWALFFLFPLWEGNSPVASQGVIVPHFTVPSLIRDKSPTRWQHSGAAQGYYSVLKHFPWQKAGGTLTETKRASASGTANLCWFYCQKHHAHEEQEQPLWAQSWVTISISLLSGTTPGSAGLHSQRKLQNADQRHHSTHCFSLSKTLLNHSIYANWSLSANSMKAFQKILRFFYIFSFTWNFTCQYDKQAKTIKHWVPCFCLVPVS